MSCVLCPVLKPATLLLVKWATLLCFAGRSDKN